MAYLVDTSVLLRFVNTTDQLHDVADRALEVLHASGEALCVAPQILIEFYNAATRPTVVNGLGYAVPVVEQKLIGIEAAFRLLEETTDIYPAWRHLVLQAGVIGSRGFRNTCRH